MNNYNHKIGDYFSERGYAAGDYIEENTSKIEVDTDNPILKSDKEIVFPTGSQNNCPFSSTQINRNFRENSLNYSGYNQNNLQQPQFYGNNLQQPHFYGDMRSPYISQQSQIDAVQLKYIDADLKNYINAMEYERKKNLEILRSELQRKRLETMEENRKKRTLFAHAVIKNSEGKMCYEIITPDGEHSMSRPIIQKSNLHMTIFVSSLMEVEERYAHVEWDGSNRPLVLEGKGFSEKGFLKLLGKNGIAVCTSRNQKENFAALVFDYLVDNASYREVPYTTGWNLLTTGEWIFERDPNKTLRGMFNV